MLRILLFSILTLLRFSLQAQVDSTENIPTDSITKGTLTINADSAIPELQERYKKGSEGKQISGYRLQLYSGRRQQAFELKADFMNKVPESPITVIYESPDFKVQAGNYRTKLEAEKAMQVIWPLYKSAFVVQTSIDLPMLPIDKGDED